MPWSDDTRCLYCNGKLPLYRRLKQGQFCSQAHQQEYEAQNERLGLERLFETHSNLQAARPKVSVESILGPEPPSTRPDPQPSAAPEPRNAPMDSQAPEWDAKPETFEAIAERREEPVAAMRESIAAPAARRPEEGVCLHCKKKLPLFQKLRHGQFCSKAHQAEYAKAQDLLGLERLFETHSNLQALRPAAGAESILGPAPSVSVPVAPAPARVAPSEPAAVVSAASAHAESIDQALQTAALPNTPGVVPGYATKLVQRAPDVIALPPAMVAADPLQYEAVARPENGRFDVRGAGDYARTALLTPGFADRVHLDLGDRLGLGSTIGDRAADVAESLGALSRNMVPTVLRATVEPAPEESFQGSLAIARLESAAGARLKPVFAGRVPISSVHIDGVETGPSASSELIGNAVPAPSASILTESFVGEVAITFRAGEAGCEPVLHAGELLPLPAAATGSVLPLRAAVDLEAQSVESRGLAPNIFARDFGGTIAANSTAATRTPAPADVLHSLTWRPADFTSVLDSASELEAVEVASPVLPGANTNPDLRAPVLGDPASQGLLSLVWRSAASAPLQASPSGIESDAWAVSTVESRQLAPQLSKGPCEPAVRDNLRCLPLEFTPPSAPPGTSVLGLIEAEQVAGTLLVSQAGRVVDVVGDAAVSLLAQVCSPGEKLLPLPQAAQSSVMAAPIAVRQGIDSSEYEPREARDLAKPVTKGLGVVGYFSLNPPLGDIVELPVRKTPPPALLSSPVEAIDVAPLSDAGVASSIGPVALGELQPRSGKNRTCKLLQPLMVLFRLAYLRNSRPVEFAARVQGNPLPESEPGQAILPRFRGVPESSLGISVEQAAASPMEFAARPAVGAVSAWTGFWHNAPRDLKILLVSIPLLAALAFSPALPKVSLHSPEESGISGRFGKAVSLQLASLRKTVLERAAVALDEDFRQGLDEWVGKGGATTEWSFDETGFVRPGPLALYRPSRGLTDYKMEFLGLIDSKALSWVVRAVDFQNYYVIKLAVVKPGQVPELELTRYAVIDGKPQDRKDTPVYLRGRGDLPYRVSVNLEGDKFSVYVQNLLMDSWNEPRLTHGGVGFFTAHGEQSRVRWVQVTHQYDTLGRLCAFLAPNEFSNTPEDR